MKRFYEKKDHLIRRNPNLTDGEKQEIIELLGRHPSYENKINWNKSNSLTYEDFMSVLRPLYINDLDPRGLIEGKDYDILYESEGEVLYFVYTYDASRILASNNVEPEIWTKLPCWCGYKEKVDEAHAFGHFDSEHGDMKPGAKWCISMQTSDRYWNQYSPDFHFLFWFRNKASLRNSRKIAIGVSKRTWKVALIYNGADNGIRTPLPSYITEAINNKKEAYKEKEKEIKINRIKSTFTFNPQTNRYDYDGNLNTDIIRNAISEDKDGFIINFGKITGEFSCSELGLKSLKGAPTEVGGNFYCYENRLTSLKGAPQKVGGSFWCYRNQLTSLEGAPTKVGGDFWCSNNKLTSLKGAPQTVGGWFECSENQLISLEGAPQKVGGNFCCPDNQLTSLEGAPQKVGGNFDFSRNHLTSLKGVPQTTSRSLFCDNNQLTSLEGAPREVMGHFSCNNNQLTSLKGAPQKVGGDFNCMNNLLTSLEGAPKEVMGHFSCNNNQLTSLKGAPREVVGYFDCCYNKLTSLEGAPQKVYGSFGCSDNKLTSLEGAPKKVGRNFDCRNNPNLHFLDGIGEVEGYISKDF